MIAVAFSDITEKRSYNVLLLKFYVAFFILFFFLNFRDSRQSVSECIAFRQTLKRSL